MPITRSSFAGRSFGEEQRAKPVTGGESDDEDYGYDNQDGPDGDWQGDGDSDSDDQRAKGDVVTIKGAKSKGQKPIKFKSGGLHESVGVPAGEPIPDEKMSAALAGKFGPKAEQQANFAKNVLGAGRKTAAKNAKKS